MRLKLSRNWKMFVNKLKKLAPSKAILIPLLFFILMDSSTHFVGLPVNVKNLATIQKYQYDNIILDEENSKLLDQIHKDNDQYYSDVLYKLLPKDRLVELAKESWRYYLNVNNVEIKTGKEQIDPKSSKIQVVLIEELANDKLPLDVARLGSVEGAGKLDNSIKLTSTKAKFTVDQKQEDKKLIVTYTFTGVEVGEIITLQLSTSLKNKLKFDNEIIEIFNSQINS